jgi:hypothetical protein
MKPSKRCFLPLRIPAAFAAIDGFSYSLSFFLSTFKSVCSTVPLEFFPEHGQKHRERGFQNRQRQQWHKEFNSIATCGASFVRRSPITVNLS